MRAIAIGKFDALHLGHRALAERAATLGAACLLGFSGMAEALGWPQRLPLVAEADRARVLATWARAGAAPAWESMPFAEVRSLAPSEFVHLLRERLRAGAVVVGEDFRFGRDRAGGIAELIALGGACGLAVAVVPAVSVAGAVVSSSRVRAALERGDCAEIAACLGRAHRLLATVVRGDGRGREIGFPTANCGTCANQPPGPGVYAGRAWIDGRGPWPAAINAGHAPTASGERPFVVEAHLIGFTGDCYGARIELELAQRLRGEKKFTDMSALVAQIGDDVAQAARLARSI